MRKVWYVRQEEISDSILIAFVINLKGIYS